MRKEIFSDVYELNSRIESLPKGTQYKEYSVPEGFVLIVQDNSKASSWTHKGARKRDARTKENSGAMLEDTQVVGSFLLKATLFAVGMFTLTEIMVG